MEGSPKNLFFRPNRPIREFQDDSDDISPEMVGNQVAPLQSQSWWLQQQMMPAMLHIICSILENGDHERTEILYKNLYQQLRKYNIMCPITGVKEFAGVQLQFKKAIHKLIVNTRQDIQMKTRRQYLPGTLAGKVESVFFQPRLDLPALTYTDRDFLPNRYRDEYVQVKEIGRGAYGAVYKVKNKLDGNVYAMKLVKFAVEEEKVYKVTREVKHLSELSHPHIVRYYTAWIENDLPALPGGGEVGPVDTNVPALEEPRALHNIQTAEGLDIDGHEEDFSDSVQFASSGVGAAAVQRVESTELSTNQHAQPVEGAGHLSESQMIDGSHDGGSMSDYPTQQQIFRHKNTLYIQMELCETNLKDWLTKRNNLHSKGQCEVSRPENLLILKQILKAVDYIHSKDLIHRDLKPHNIFINSGSRHLEVKLGDFGLSRHIQATHHLATDATATTSSQPETRDLLTPHPGIGESFDWSLHTKGVGTTIYAAPEQLQGNDYNNKSDMYSLGLIAYELFCAFHTETERRTCLHKIRTEPPPDEFQKLWPIESGFIKRLLTIDPTTRPSAQDLLTSQLILSKDQVIKNLRSDKDELRAENAALKLELRKHAEESERRESEIARLTLQVLTLSESVRRGGAGGS